MAMQQSSKGASGSGSNPALSDEQAEQFAASFTPAWDAEDGLGDSTAGTADATINSTMVMEAAPPPPAPHATNLMATMIGGGGAPANAAPAPAPAPPPAPAPAPHVNHGMATQMMEGRPSPARPPAPAPAAHAPPAAQASRVAVAADPFRSVERTARRPASTDDLDLVPKRSSKTIIFVVAGLAMAGGLGLFLRFALSDDPPKTAPTQLVTGPAATTAEIPPPPPKVETPAAPTTTAVTAARTAEPPPPPLAVPPRAAVEPVAARAGAAPAAAPRQPPRGAALPAPQAGAVTPPPPASPKTPPKGPNGGIVRDNPF